MTNPDNVGGLPELPEPIRMGLNDAIPFGGYYTADQMRAYGELCRASAGREAVAWQCRARWGDGWTEWQECSKEQFDEKLPLTGYRSDELETEFRALYTTPSPTAPELPKQGEGGREDHSGNAAEMVAVESIIETMLCAAALLEQSGSVINRREGAALRVQADELRALAKKAAGA